MKTAVEWFAERIQSDKIFNFETVLSKAKKMEKQQIMKHSLELAKILISNPYETTGKMPTELIDSYINKTFKSE